MHIEILTPESVIFSGEADLIRLPGTKGSFEILKNHAPLISTLEAGTIKVVPSGGETRSFRIKRGMVECIDNQVYILVTPDLTEPVGS